MKKGFVVKKVRRELAGMLPGESKVIKLEGIPAPVFRSCLSLCYGPGNLVTRVIGKDELLVYMIDGGR